MMNRIRSRHATRRSADSERGAEALQYAITAAIIIPLIFAIIQTGMFFYARSIASGAADKALQAARVETGSTGAGQAAGRQFISAAGPRALSGTSVSVSRGPDTTTVTVSGRMPSVIPFLRLPAVAAHAQGPTERVTG